VGELPVAALSAREAIPGGVPVVEVFSEERGISRVLLRWKSETKLKDAVFTDPTCSPFALEVSRGTPGLPESIVDDGGWAYLGCRSGSVEAGDGKKWFVDVLAVVDSASGARLERFRLRARPGSFPLGTSVAGETGAAEKSAGRQREGQKALNLNYKVPERFSLGFLNAGLGPYSYQFRAPGVSVNTIAPVVTVYSGLTLTRDYRLVVFNATSVHRYFFTDIGAYFHMEYARILDRRMSISLMLGAHVIAYPLRGKTQNDFWAPQGFEVTFRDAFMKNRNLGVGAFIYPNIENESYYNLWLRWGSPTIFGEINYIDWVLRPDGQRVQSRAFGLCLGFPLARFL
jgi:hypothetical protein